MHTDRRTGPSGAAAVFGPQKGATAQQVTQLDRNLAHLAQVMPVVAAGHPDLVAAVAGLFLVSFGIKAGLFPLYFWLPSSYHTPPVAVSPS